MTTGIIIYQAPIEGLTLNRLELSPAQPAITNITLHTDWAVLVLTFHLIGIYEQVITAPAWLGRPNNKRFKNPAQIEKTRTILFSAFLSVFLFVRETKACHSL